MLSFRHRSSLPGWVAIAPSGAHLLSVHVRTDGAGRPAVLWADRSPWAVTEQARTQALREARRSRGLQRHHNLLLLERSQYQIVPMEAPDVPRDEWRDAVRWQLKEMVEFDVATAAVDVLEVPSDGQQRRKATLMAVAAPHSALGPLAAAGEDAQLPLQTIDIPETALRNLSALSEEPARAHALLHVSDGDSTLVLTHAGELLSTRHIDVGMRQLNDDDESARAQAFDRAALELQRTLDSFERQFSHVALSRLQVTPGPGMEAFAEQVRELLYVPVLLLDLSSVVDLSAVPHLQQAQSQADFLPAIGAALRAP